MLAKKTAMVIGATACAAILGAGAAIAQQLDPGISCIDGEVSGTDWAELTSRYKESIWDSKAAVRLNAESEQLELTVTDFYGNNVCEQTADLKTRCKFNFPASYSGLFNIRVDNLQASSTRYRLCAE
jgi:hypothetical protein